MSATVPFVALHQQGMKIKEIAKRVGLGARTIQRWLTQGEYVETDYHHAHRSRFDAYEAYVKYGARGGEPYAPELLLGLLLYGYATGVFSSRKIERATYESVAFRFIAGNLHPDHDTLAVFRRTFLPELKDLFVQVLLLAQEAGVLKLGTISLDGTKVHADASKRKAVSYKRLLELETQVQAEVEELFALGEQSEQPEVGGVRGDYTTAGPPGAAGEGQSGAGSSREGAGGSRASRV
jgi:transposase